MSLQALHPACDMPSVAPARSIRLMDGMGSIPEGRHRRLALVRDGVPTARNARSIFRRLFASLGQRLTDGKPPKPISRRRPSTVIRCTQDFRPALLM